MKLLEFLPVFVLPAILVLLGVVFLFSKKQPTKYFYSGVNEGLQTVIGLLPTMLLIMCAVRCFFVSGMADVLCNLFLPLFSFFGIPKELMPTLVLRPFSGSAVTSLADNLFAQYGADSYVSKIACCLMGSTDTIIYTLSVYFESAGIKKTRYATAVSFVVFAFSIFVSVVVGNAFFT